MAVQLDRGLKTGSVARGSQPLLIEHRSAIQLLEHKAGASRDAPTLDIARHIRGTPGGDVNARHSSKPSATSSA
jgi:hypothetical protein